jgi:hypothetical protein
MNGIIAFLVVSEANDEIQSVAGVPPDATGISTNFV